MVAACLGDIERQLQDDLSPWWVHGEWFHWIPETKQLVFAVMTPQPRSFAEGVPLTMGRRLHRLQIDAGLEVVPAGTVDSDTVGMDCFGSFMEPPSRR